MARAVTLRAHDALREAFPDKQKKELLRGPVREVSENGGLAADRQADDLARLIDGNEGNSPCPADMAPVKLAQP